MPRVFPAKFDQWIFPITEISAGTPTALAHGLSLVANVMREFQDQGENELCERVSSYEHLLFVFTQPSAIQQRVHMGHTAHLQSLRNPSRRHQIAPGYSTLSLCATFGRVEFHPR